MRTHIRRGGIVFFAAVFIFFIAVSVLIGVFAYRGRDIATVSLSKRYYFLIRDCESTTAGAVAGESYFAGGAGFLLESENAVVLAGYYSESDAAFVEGTMSAKGVPVRVLMKELSPFAVNGEAASCAQRIEACGEVMDDAARLLFDAANGLERNTLSQEGARAAVLGAAQSLAGLVRGNEGAAFSLLNPELSRIGQRARELSAGILFAKDLRYLQVKLLFTVLGLDGYFA